MSKKSILPIIMLVLFSCLAIQAQEFSMKVNNNNRSYLVRLPNNYDPLQKIPLHIFLHGGNFAKEEAESIYGFTEHADTSGYILVYPQGLNKSWSRENDFVFISSLIDTLTKNFAVDKQRIYVSGHSAGCILVNLLACELSHKIAAFGDVGGFMLNSYSKYYKPVQPVPYVKIHGTSDDVILYAGDSDIISVDSVISFYKHHNHAQSLKDSVALPDIVTTDHSSVIKYTYGQDNSEIVFYQVVGGGHDAPDWNGNNEMGYTNRDINTPEVLWDFFKNHALSGAKVTFISNAGFLIESGNKKVLIDALFTEGYGYYTPPSTSVIDKICNGIPPFHSVDLFLVSHDHDDHFKASIVSRQLKNNITTRFVCPKNVETQLKTEPDYNSFSSRIIVLTTNYNKHADTSANGIPVKVMRMQHDNRPEFENNGYLFTIDNLKILHVGDYTGAKISDLDTFNLKNENIDIAFLNYYCYFGESETYNKVLESINAKHIILYHIENGDLKVMSDSVSQLKNTTFFNTTFESAYYGVDTSFITNKAPVLLNPIPDTIAHLGQNINIRIKDNAFSDDYNDFLFYEAKLSSNGHDLPEWLKFNSTTKTFSGIPPVEENLSIKVTAVDLAGASISDIFSLELTLTSSNDIKNETDKIQVFPNPASNTIHIKSTNPEIQIDSYQLIDMSGRMVMHNNLDSDVIDIAEIKSGVYMLNLISGSEIYREVVLIE
ncbi:MAG: MBL fold metallo-hydrolase [Bacteroidota bacterium]|nr:MAG: MBL fold metallo-hydrolase [Bacteroidota bacterium]